MWIFFMDWTLKTGKEIVSQDIKYWIPPNEVIQFPTQKIGYSLKAINETSEISLVLHLLPIYWIKIQDEGREGWEAEREVRLQILPPEHSNFK